MIGIVNPTYIRASCSQMYCDVAVIGGKSYMTFNKVPAKTREFCESLNIRRKEVGRKFCVCWEKMAG